MTEDELKHRLKQFALRVLTLCDALPRSPKGRAIATQLSRSGTSPGANYRAACCARSKPDFIAKLAIAEEEADESIYWLELIIDGNILPKPRIAPLCQEANELTRILCASRKSASLHLRAEKPRPHTRPQTNEK